MQEAAALAGEHARELGAQHAALAQARTLLTHGAAVLAARQVEDEAERALLRSRAALLRALQGCLSGRRAALREAGLEAVQWERAAVGMAEEAQRESYGAWG